MADQGSISVRMFGALHAVRRDQGLPTECELAIPVEGLTARQVAAELSLPLERVEGVFRNRVVQGLGVTILPGDRIAFVPRGTPGPHRYFLGLYEAGHAEATDDE